MLRCQSIFSACCQCLKISLLHVVKVLMYRLLFVVKVSRNCLMHVVKSSKHPYCMLSRRQIIPTACCQIIPTACCQSIPFCILLRCQSILTACCQGIFSKCCQGVKVSRYLLTSCRQNVKMSFSYILHVVKVSLL